MKSKNGRKIVMLRVNRYSIYDKRQKASGRISFKKPQSRRDICN